MNSNFSNKNTYEHITNQNIADLGMYVRIYELKHACTHVYHPCDFLNGIFFRPSHLNLTRFGLESCWKVALQRREEKNNTSLLRGLFSWPNCPEITRAAAAQI